MKVLMNLQEVAVSDIYLPENYKEGTINLVNDGVSVYLTVLINGCVSTLAIPNKDIFKSYAADAKREENERGQKVQQDYYGEINHKLEYLLKSAKEQVEPIEVPQSQSFNINDIINMIAVLQKPELLKDIK